MPSSVQMLIVAWCVALGSCAEPKLEATQFRPSYLGGCYFEATVPASVSFERLTTTLQPNRQFCSWTSFKDRKFVGRTSVVSRDTRSGWEILNDAPLAETRVCNVQSMIDAGWKLRPLSIETNQEEARVCGGYGGHLRDIVEPLDGIVGRLPELCFRPLQVRGRVEVLPIEIWARAASLNTYYTLPVRHILYDETRRVLRLWFDDEFDAAWADDWPGRVKIAFREMGLELVDTTCPIR
jgi:hypothetical protein